MGSGHFLVAAVDRIEARMANYLRKRQEQRQPLTQIQQELTALRTSAQNELGEIKDDFAIEDRQLLRRQIAKRCIYGVDLNSLAVDLARLSIWIHTFVPGLPLSLLDHNLVRGNSLVGVGTVDEIVNKFDQMRGTLFAVNADSLLGEAARPLRKLATLKDATPTDIEDGRIAIHEARDAIQDTEALCDLITAQPITEDADLNAFPFEDWGRAKDTIHTSKELQQARLDLEGLDPFHFPVQFPEVFLGNQPGFDVLVGNPPWKKFKVEELGFWTRISPGMRSKSHAEQNAKQEELKASRPDLLTVWQEEAKQNRTYDFFPQIGQISRNGEG